MKKAWKLLRDKRSAAGFLAAKRMGLSEQEYVDFLAKNPELYQISLLVEEQLKDCRQKWQGTPEQAFVRPWRGLCKMVPEIFAKNSWQIKSKSWKKNTGKRFRDTGVLLLS